MVKALWVKASAGIMAITIRNLLMGLKSTQGLSFWSHQSLFLSLSRLTFRHFNIVNPLKCFSWWSSGGSKWIYSMAWASHTNKRTVIYGTGLHFTTWLIKFWKLFLVLTALVRHRNPRRFSFLPLPLYLGLVVASLSLHSFLPVSFYPCSIFVSSGSRGFFYLVLCLYWRQNTFPLPCLTFFSFPLLFLFSFHFFSFLFLPFFFTCFLLFPFHFFFISCLFLSFSLFSFLFFWLWLASLYYSFISCHCLYFFALSFPFLFFLNSADSERLKQQLFPWFYPVTLL